MQMRCKWECKRGKSFSSFSYELREKQEQREQRKKELGVKLVELGKGSAMGSLCTGSYRGAPPLSRPTMGFLPSIKAKEQGLLKLPQTELHLSALVFFLPLFIQLLFLLQVHKKKKKKSAFPPSFRVRVSFQPHCKNVFVVVLLPRKNDFVVRTRPHERFCGVL